MSRDLRSLWFSSRREAWRQARAAGFSRWSAAWAWKRRGRVEPAPHEKDR